MIYKNFNLFKYILVNSFVVLISTIKFSMEINFKKKQKKPPDFEDHKKAFLLILKKNPFY